MRLMFFLVIISLTSCLNKQSNERSIERDLGFHQDLTDSEFGYLFMNQNIFGGDNKKGWCKLKTRMLRYDSRWAVQIKSLDSLLRKEEMIYMINQLDTTNKKWECSHIEKVHCFSRNYLDSMFSIEPIIKLENGQEEYVDAWEEFRKTQGGGGIHSYSFPIFNQDRTVLLLEHGEQFDWEMGSGETHIYKREGNQWELVTEILHWIS